MFARYAAFVLHLSVYLGSFALAMVLPLLPMLIDTLLDEKHASLSSLSHWSGLAAAATPLMVALTLPVWMTAARQGHAKWLLRLVLVIGGVLLASLAKVQHLEQVVLLRLGLGCVACMPILAVAVAPSLGMPRFAGRLTGWVRLMIQASLVLGPPLGGLLAHGIGVRMTLVTAGLISVTAGLIMTVAFDHPLSAPDTSEPEPDKERWPAAQRTVWSGAMLLLQAGTAAVGPLLALHLMEGLEIDYDRVTSWTGVILGAMALSGLITSLCANLIADLLPIRTTLVIGCVLAMGLTWLMAHTADKVVLMAWAIAWSGVMTALITLMLAAAGRHRTMRERLSMLGWLAAVEPVGAALGPLAAAWGAAIRPQAIFTLSGIITLAAIPLITAMKIPAAQAPMPALGRFAPSQEIVEPLSD
ncbi:MAG: MFS transporter [Candidatus Sericytochromatia bacterium]|nr:MFS transporter [Candidatus Sericytochromatia bacterium]